jgi:hypothetical protein
MVPAIIGVEIPEAERKSVRIIGIIGIIIVIGSGIGVVVIRWRIIGIVTIRIVTIRIVRIIAIYIRGTVDVPVGFLFNRWRLRVGSRVIAFPPHDLPGPVRLPACRAVPLLLLTADEDGLTEFPAVLPLGVLEGFDRDDGTRLPGVGIHPVGGLVCFVVFQSTLQVVFSRLRFRTVKGLTEGCRKTQQDATCDREQERNPFHGFPPSERTFPLYLFKYCYPRKNSFSCNERTILCTKIDVDLFLFIIAESGGDDFLQTIPSTNRNRPPREVIAPRAAG